MPVHQLSEALKGVRVLPEEVHHLEQVPRDAPLVQLDVAPRHSLLVAASAGGVTRVALSPASAAPPLVATFAKLTAPSL